MKIYFGIFGVRLVFLFIFLPSGIIKKTNRLRAVPERDTARGQPLNSAAPSRPSPSAPPRSAHAAEAAAADDPISVAAEPVKTDPNRPFFRFSLEWFILVS